MAAPFRLGSIMAGRVVLRYCLERHTPSQVLLQRYDHTLSRHTSCQLQHKEWDPHLAVAQKHTPSGHKITIGTTVKGIRMPTIKHGDIVNLLGPDNEALGSMKRKEADKLAVEKSLKLVIVDPDSQPYPTLRILSGKQLAEEQKRERQLRRDSKHKDAKLIHIKSSISDHDMTIKTTHVLQWINKGHDVKVAIKNMDRTSDKVMSALFKVITDSVGSLATVHKAKHSKEELRFTLKATATEGDTGDQVEEEAGAGSVPKPLKLEDLKQKQKEN